MKLLLFSDSHGCNIYMNKAILKHKYIDMIIHLGDYVKDALEIKKAHKQLLVEYIRGNNDWSSEFPNDKIIEIMGKKIFLTHGHSYGVKNGYERIKDISIQKKVDAVFFGHTHIPVEIYQDGIILLNPGSVGAYGYTANATYCEVEITQERIITKHYKA